MPEKKMTALELVNKVAEDTGLTKRDTRACVDAFLARITEALGEGTEVTVPNHFGKFKSVERKARTGRNPQTGDKIEIPAHNAPVFYAGKMLKEAVRK